MNKRIHAIYSGRVQGIGFRYTVEEIALNLGVRGWVKNLSDGTVEITAEAPDEMLKLFLDKIKSHFFSHINDVELDWFPATGEFKDFEIAF